jgi:hypothetical protein
VGQNKTNCKIAVIILGVSYSPANTASGGGKFRQQIPGYATPKSLLLYILLSLPVLVSVTAHQDKLLARPTPTS